MALANEVVIKFSKLKILWFVAMVLVVISGLASLVQGGSLLKYIMAVVAIIVGAVIAYHEYPNLLLSNKPQLTISKTGVTTADATFYEWREISNEKLMPVGSAKPTWFLWFETATGNRKLHLDDLDKRPDEIMALIKAYRAAEGKA